jgi:hypothetical protein
MRRTYGSKRGVSLFARLHGDPILRMSSKLEEMQRSFAKNGSLA